MSSLKAVSVDRSILLDITVLVDDQLRIIWSLLLGDNYSIYPLPDAPC